MDASVLRQSLEKLLFLDEKYAVQKNFGALRDALQNLASQPADSSFQTNFSTAFKNLKESFAKMQAELTPGDWDRLWEISSVSDFDKTIVEYIEREMEQNTVTLAVARDNINKKVEYRQREVKYFSDLKENLEHFGIYDDQNDIDKSQIGFKIPREIFKNKFVVMIEELNFIKRLIRMINEAEGVDQEDIEVGTISTTDPVFWLVVSYAVGKSLGGLTTWALATWKSVEEIRNIRAQTANLGSFNEEEIKSIFDSKIDNEVKIAIDKKLSEMKVVDKKEPRDNEIENGMRILLRQFLARIERGMTVDIKYIIHEESKNDMTEQDAAAVESRRIEVKEMASSLEFKEPSGSPILRIEMLPPIT